LNNLFQLLKVSVLISATSMLVNAQAPVSVGSSNRGVEVEVKTDKSRYIIGEQIGFTVLLINRGTSAVYIAKSFLSSGGGIAGFSLSVKQTKGKGSPECALFVDRFGDTAGPRSGNQILREDFLRLAPGGIVGFTGRYRGCAVKHQGSYQLTAIYCPCDLNTATARSAAKQESTETITESIESKPWPFSVQQA